jgi:hypothetical protein
MSVTEHGQTAGAPIAPILEAISDYMIKFGSHQRPHVFLDDIAERFAGRPEIIWRVLHDEWNGFDAIPHARFTRLFSRIHEHWRVEYMNADDREFYASLPERFTVYRGQESFMRTGLSWTLDWDIAAKFSHGLRGPTNISPAIVIAEAYKRHVAGAYVGRKDRQSFRRRDRIVASSHRAQGLFWLGLAPRGSCRVHRKRTTLRMVQ